MAIAGDVMCEAADRGDVATVEEWLAKDKAFVNARDADDMTVLHHAATAGSVPVVRVLLKGEASDEKQ